MAMLIQSLDGVVVNRFEIDASGLSFGRNTQNHVQIDDLAVSGEHARISQYQNEQGQTLYLLEDLNSTNGSYINEQAITRQQLNHKDIIRIGWNNFTFIDESQQDMEQTSEIKKSWIPGVYYSKDK